MTISAAAAAITNYCWRRQYFHHYNNVSTVLWWQTFSRPACDQDNEKLNYLLWNANVKQ